MMVRREFIMSLGSLNVPHIFPQEGRPAPWNPLLESAALPRLGMETVIGLEGSRRIHDVTSGCQLPDLSGLARGTAALGPCASGFANAAETGTMGPVVAQSGWRVALTYTASIHPSAGACD